MEASKIINMALKQLVNILILCLYIFSPGTLWGHISVLCYKKDNQTVCIKLNHKSIKYCPSTINTQADTNQSVRQQCCEHEHDLCMDIPLSKALSPSKQKHKNRLFRYLSIFIASSHINFDKILSQQPINNTFSDLLYSILHTTALRKTVVLLI